MNIVLGLFMAAALSGPAPAAAVATDAAPIVIKMGTVVPQDSVWHTMLRKMGQDWATISEGKVTLRIYPGGVLGDEPDLVRKMRIGQLQAVGLSAAGLYAMHPSVMALQIPLLIGSYAELDYIRDRMSERLAGAIERQGFVVLYWTDGGWIYFFTKQPTAKPDAMRKCRLFVWAGDADAVNLFKSAGFRPVPLQVMDMLSALQTGLIDAFPSPPLVALVNQWFAPPLSGYMLDLKWVPLIGAAVVSRSAWRRIPEEIRPRMLEAARKAGAEFQQQIRGMSTAAVGAMEKRGLSVVPVDAETLELWREEVKGVYPQLRGGMIPADFFDEAVRLHEEYVRSHGKAR